MTPKEKYKEEKDNLKNSRISRILESAFELFAEKGIDNVTMNDIAAKAEIGVASLYRYFETKEEIAVQTSIWAWERQKSFIMPQLLTDTFNNATGINQLSIIFSMFIKLYENQVKFLRYIYFFDSYAVRIKMEKDRLMDYEKTIESTKNIIAASISRGIEDKSINSKYKESQDVLYFTLMHALFASAQKLSLSGDMLLMDELVNGKQELELLSALLLDALRVIH